MGAKYRAESGWRSLRGKPIRPGSAHEPYDRLLFDAGEPCARTRALSCPMTFVTPFLPAHSEFFSCSCSFRVPFLTRETRAELAVESPRPCPRPGGNCSESPTRRPVRVRSRRAGRCGNEAGSTVDPALQGEAGALRTHTGRAPRAEARDRAQVSRDDRLLQAAQKAPLRPGASWGRRARPRARATSSRATRTGDRGAPASNSGARRPAARGDVSEGRDLRCLRQLLP